eukprot:6490589-Amphidinium_carterae.1
MMGKGRRDLQHESTEAITAYKDRTALELRSFMQEHCASAREEDGQSSNEWLAALTAARKTNRSFLRSLDASLVGGLGWGLREFKPARLIGALPEGATRYIAEVALPDGSRVPRSCIALASGAREMEVPRKFVGGACCRPVLHIAADQGPGSMAGYLWLKTGLRLRCSLSFDLFHRLTNDWRSGFKAGSLNLLLLEFKIFTSMRHGPWQRQGTDQLLRELAEEYFSLSPGGVDDPLFNVMYDQILGDNPQLAGQPHVGSAEHIHEVWEWSRAQMLGAGIGEKDDLSRWWAWEQQSRLVKPLRSLTLMLLAYLGMRRKWWKTASEPLMGWMVADADGSDEPLPGEKGRKEDDGEGKDEEEEEDHAGEDECDWQAVGGETVSKARSELAKRRNTVQTLKFLTKLLADQTRCRVWTGMMELPRPLELFFARAITEVKKIESLKALHLRLCKLELHGIAAALLRRFLSTEFGSLIGMKAWSGSVRTGHLQKQDKTVALALWQAVCHGSGRIALTSLSYTLPPVCLLKLLSPDEADITETLQDMEKCWHALMQLEATAIVNKDAATFLKNLTVASDIWFRELLVFCFEVSFKHVPEIVKREVEAYSRTAFSSLMVECGFNILRDKASKNRGGKLDPGTAWHVLSHGNLLPSFDRPRLVPPPGAVAASDGVLPSGLHDGIGLPPSLPEETFDEITCKTPGWPTHSPETYTQIPMAWQLLQRCSGDWCKMQLSWLSLLLDAGCLVLDGDSKKAYLVVHVSQYGCLCIRTPVHTNRQVLVASDGENQIKWLMLEEPLQRWRVADMNVVTPGATASSVGAITLQMNAGGCSLLRHAAKRGFKNMSLTFLRKLVQHLAIPMKGNITGANVLTCMTLLVQHVYNTDFTDEVLEQALQARGVSGSKVDQTELFKSTSLFEVDKECVLDDEDVCYDDLVLQYEDMRTQHVKQTGIKSKAVAAASIPNPSGAASSSTTREPQKRKFVPIDMAGYTQQQAAEFVPPGCRIYKDKRENRWRISSPHFAEGLSNIKSKSWGLRSGSDYDAMVCVLQIAWVSHQHATGIACPFSFEA